MVVQAGTCPGLVSSCPDSHCHPTGSYQTWAVLLAALLLILLRGLLLPHVLLPRPRLPVADGKPKPVPSLPVPGCATFSLERVYFPSPPILQLVAVCLINCFDNLGLICPEVFWDSYSAFNSRSPLIQISFHVWTSTMLL